MTFSYNEQNEFTSMVYPLFVIYVGISITSKTYGLFKFWMMQRWVFHITLWIFILTISWMVVVMLQDHWFVCWFHLFKLYRFQNKLRLSLYAFWSCRYQRQPDYATWSVLCGWQRRLIRRKDTPLEGYSCIQSLT